MLLFLLICLLVQQDQPGDQLLASIGWTSEPVLLCQGDSPDSVSGRLLRPVDQHQVISNMLQQVILQLACDGPRKVGC